MEKTRAPFGRMVIGAGLLAWAGAVAGNAQEVVLPPQTPSVIAKSSPLPVAPVPGTIERMPALMPLPAGPGAGSASAGSLPGLPPSTGTVTPLVARQPTIVPDMAPVASPLIIQKTGPSSVWQGKPVEYVISVRNQGQATLKGVQVEDDLPRGAKLLRSEPPAVERQGKLSWMIDQMERGEERRFKVEIEPRERGEISGTTTATFAVTSTMQAKVLSIEATVDMQGPLNVVVGSSVQYQLQVVNSGDAPLANIVVRVELPEGLQHVHGTSIEAPLGTLAPGEKRLLPLQIKAVKKGVQRNRVMIQSNGKTIGEQMQEIQVDEPVLSLHGPEQQNGSLNREIEVPLEVANAGKKPAKAAVTAHFPDGLDVVSASDDGQYDSVQHAVVWQLDGLPAEQSRILRVKAVPHRPGDLACEATVRGEQAVEGHAHQTIHVDASSAVKLDMVASEEPLVVGADSVYTIHLINEGDTPSANLKVCAVAPEGMYFVAAEAPVRFTVENQEIRFAGLPELAGRSEVSYRIRVRGLTSGECHFRVYMNCQQSDKQTCLERTVHVVEPRK